MFVQNILVPNLKPFAVAYLGQLLCGAAASGHARGRRIIDYCFAKAAVGSNQATATLQKVKSKCGIELSTEKKVAVLKSTF